MSISMLPTPSGFRRPNKSEDGKQWLRGGFFHVFTFCCLPSTFCAAAVRGGPASASSHE